MSEINLLPWRDEVKAQRLKVLIIGAIGIWILGGFIVFGAYSYFDGVKKNHGVRNSFLKTEIAALDEEIKEIDQLRKRRDQIIARMQVIQNLQSDRTELVHILSDLVRTVPDGVYISNLQLQDSKVSLTGRAESNARVSTFMRELEASSWYHDPSLQVIQASGGLNTFSLLIAKAGAIKKPKL